MKEELISFRVPGWCCYGVNTSKQPAFNQSDKIGKFMFFGEGNIEVELQEKILLAIKQGVTPLVKHTDLNTLDLNPHSRNGSWVVIWYSNDDTENLKKLALFLKEHGFIRKTKAGKLFNISFKYDEQTRNNEYGEEFTPSIKLDSLMNLTTGELLK